MDDQPQIKKERSKKMRDLGESKKTEFSSKFIGKTLDAIVSVGGKLK